MTLIGEYAEVAGEKVLADLKEQRDEAANPGGESTLTHEAEEASKSEEELEQMQRELLEGAPFLLKPFGIAFTVFLSHRRATGQGPIGRMYMALKDDYRCFLDSEVTFKLHNLRALVQACNYFLFFLSGGIFDQSPFCLEELLSAIHTNRRIFVVRDLHFRLPEDIKATVAEVMRNKLGEDSIREHYGWSVDEAAARVEMAVTAAWPSRITYHAEHFEPCIKRIRQRLGLAVVGQTTKVTPLLLGSETAQRFLQPKPDQVVDFVGLNGLLELDLSRKGLDQSSLLVLASVLRADACSITSLK